MISIGLIMALTAAFIFALGFFWKDLVNWIKKAVAKIKEVLGIVVEGTRTFIARTREGLKERSKYYNKNKLTNEWEERIYTKSIDESEVPPEILAKAKKHQIDEEVSTTEELKLVLGA